MTDKNIVFCEEYLKCWNASAAARKAQYKKPGQYGHELLKKPEIQEYISNRLGQLAMDADEVIYRIGQQARGHIADFVSVVKPEDGQPYLVVDPQKVVENGHLVRKIKYDKDGRLILELHDPQDALQLLARHHGLLVDKHAFVDWREEPTALIKDGKLTFDQIAGEFGRDIAEELFISAGVKIVTGGKAAEDGE